jgi:hypothetical protein
MGVATAGAICWAFFFSTDGTGTAADIKAYVLPTP